MKTIELTGFDLSWKEVKTVLHALPKISLSNKAKEKIEKSRLIVDKKAASKEPHYGINTGFGKLATTQIDPEKLETLQHNLIYS
ncbi:MAG: aromatic amino acid lyase, partial [bacterium]|nr:aromatic amino acid lyase [bacterium]